MRNEISKCLEGFSLRHQKLLKRLIQIIVTCTTLFLFICTQHKNNYDLLPSTDSSNEGTIFIATLPVMAEVFMDGKKIGIANMADLKITAGTHVMLFVKGTKKLEKKMSFTPGKHPPQLIRLK